jgi:hypothetical protein
MAAYTFRAQARDFYGGVDTVPLSRYIFGRRKTNGLAFAFCYGFPTPYRRDHRIRIRLYGMYLDIDCEIQSIKGLAGRYTWHLARA